jgi:uncharacterized protein
MKSWAFSLTLAIKLDMYVQMCIYWDSCLRLWQLRKAWNLFADATTTLEDDLALTMGDPFSENEDRWITIGKDATGRLLVMVYAW